MKKIYLTPSIQMSLALTTQMIAESNIPGGSGSQPGEANSKSSSIWENFEKEDEK